MMSPRPISEVRGSSNFRSTAFLAFKVICYEVPISFCSSFRFSSIFWPTLQCPYFVLATSVQTPLQIIHIVGNFLRIWSVYSMYRYLTQTGASVILFIFSCLVPSSILFLLLQKPWKGRSLSNTQVVPSVINGAITALYFILWGKGLKSCGPLRAILAEYSGAVLGVLSAVLYGRRGHLWKKFDLINLTKKYHSKTASIQRFRLNKYWA
ncbi:zinc transporter 5 [Gossypium australe]|uniref:Zinc transporter 5 n=1 Tax=Gossypium australe TaxID=47621 RepID=A0A5B6UVN4_9ROSI|nr:zinc transporter 5 [Gossypium australe]